MASTAGPSNLSVDSGKRQHVAQSLAEERRRAEQRVRAEIAAQMEREVEQRLSAAEGQKAAAAKQEHAADEARWRSKEAEWRKRCEAAEAARDEVALKLKASERALREAAGAEARRAADAQGDRAELLALHAKAMEEVNRSKDELRRENTRLRVQQRLFEEEVQAAEHDARVNTIETDEVKNAMGQAVRELVPLRNKVRPARQAIRRRRAARWPPLAGSAGACVRSR